MRNSKMLKKIFLSIITIILPLSLLAVPAKRGIFTTITTAEGTKVRVELRGDEFAHWWQAEDGTRYEVDAENGTYKVKTQMTPSELKRRAVAIGKSRSRAMRRVADNNIFKGEKKGLIILVDFPNMSFSRSDVKALYNDIANKENYTDNGFNGSIRDYFREQSGGQFTLDFDVAGPVTMTHSYSYYGRNNEDKAPEMIKEACQGVDSLINFADYDWDGDGEVEEVFVLYAGHGQADYNSTNDNLIWPHMYYVNPYDDPDNDFYLDDVKINVYACSSELNGDGDIAGIGTFCHEFSHCMGFPDMYDTADGGTNFGMGSWDLMDYGSYNGNGYTPAGYSGYERMVCGWTNPIELTKDTTITSVQPLIDQGQSFIVYNQGNRNEYYILTNRQQHGYDADIPGHGMLVEHIDYDPDIWEWNAVNTTNGAYERNGVDFTNDHQRITIFHANNSESTYYEGDAAYPYYGNDSLTINSKPAATVYNTNSDGSKYMNCAIRNIMENEDGTISFDFGKVSSSNDSDTTIVVPTEGVLFHETFDKCNGKGGNDGTFSGSLGSQILTDDVCDNKGWSFSKGFRGDRCARLGTGSVVGAITSPSFTLNGDTATLSFRAACWDGSRDGTDLEVSVQGTNVKLVDSDGAFTMTKGAFTSYTLKLVGTGLANITFTPSKRFFLDDVLVESKNVSTGIKTIESTKRGKDGRIYTVSGQYVGKDLKSLPKGIYIVDGKKVLR